MAAFGFCILAQSIDISTGFRSELSGLPRIAVEGSLRASEGRHPKMIPSAS